MTITFSNGRPPVRVEAGESYSTSDDEELTAMRKAGFETDKKGKGK